MTEACCCPTCGAPMHSTGIVVSLNDNTITSPLGSISLRPIEAEVAHVLAKRSPAFVHHEPLFSLVYGKTGYWPDRRTMYVHISHLRKRIKAIGIEIETLYGVGCRMRLAAAEEKAA